MKILKGKATGKVAVTRLPLGSDLLDGVNQLAKEAGFASATVQFIGAVSQAVIQAYDPKQREYLDIVLEGPLEILSGLGNISMRDDEPFAHIHAVLGDLEGHCRGGHVAKGTTVFIAEVVLTEIETDEILERKADDKTGLSVW